MYKRLLLFFPLVLVAFAAVYPVLHKEKEKVQCDTAVIQISPERLLVFNQLMTELQSRAAKFPGESGILIKDLATGKAIDINSSKLFPSASLVKVPIMAVLFQAQEEGKLNLSDELAVQRRQKVRDCSKIYFARTGTKFTVRDLIERMITESDNTATNMLVDALGFGYINQKFVELGLANTDLKRGIMDLKWRRAGIENYTTAEDMASLLERMYRRELVSARASDEMLAILKRQKVNDRIPRLLPDGLVIAHKTGLLRGTVSDCGIVYTREGDFLICVLTADIRNYKTAKRFIARVAATTYNRCYKPAVETVKS